MKKTVALMLLATGLVMGSALAEDAGGPPPGGKGGRRPPSPVVNALDLNSDGTLDADEIAKASASLKKLDKNGDGKLTADELRPPRPPRGGHGPDRPPPGDNGPGEPPPES
ncbi:MAG: hypothetical protein WC708_16130 [Lentisphaeria bacterium]